MDKKVEVLLTRVNTALADHIKQIQERRRRLKKADSRKSAEKLEGEIEALGARLDVLKIHQKALKRGIIPRELDGETAG